MSSESIFTLASVCAQSLLVLGQKPARLENCEPSGMNPFMIDSKGNS